jgi:hypothetical protein
MGLPWEEQDGHGLIRQIHRSFGKPDKKPGEVILYGERGSYWIYDVAGTTKIATKDGWGLGEEREQALGEMLRRPPTKKEITAEAVRQDMDFCRKFLSGDIVWFTVSCWSEEDPDAIEYLSGFLCEHGDSYLEDAAKMMAGDYLVLKESAQKELLDKQAAREAELDLIMAGL